MFKFKDQDGSQVWIKPDQVCSIEHNKIEGVHTIVINMTNATFYVEPTSEEDCRKFMFDLFKAMGEEYRYE